MKDEKKIYKLKISKNQIVGRMLFNPLFKDPKLFVYDVENQELSGPMDIYYADKDHNGYYISAVKFEKDFYKLVKPSRYEGSMIFAADIDSTSNKNITFDASDKKVLTIVESNKLRASVIKTNIDLDKYPEMKYILVFVSDCLFASPMIGVEDYNHLKSIALDLHEWLAYGNITDKFRDAFKSYIGDQEIDVIQSYQSITKLFNTSMNENIFTNEYGDVILYTNKDIGIKMNTEVLDSGLIRTEIFIDDVLIYQSETDGYTRISVNEEFLQNQVERGIYRKDPETDEYYVEDKSGKKVLVISITNGCIQFQYPDKKFMATIASDHMQVVSESISVYMDANSYNDPFTYIDNGTIYYSDYSEDYMYIRDVFGVPCLNA